MNAQTIPNDKDRRLIPWDEAEQFYKDHPNGQTVKGGVWFLGGWQNVNHTSQKKGKRWLLFRSNEALLGPERAKALEEAGQ